MPPVPTLRARRFPPQLRRPISSQKEDKTSKVAVSDLLSSEKSCHLRERRPLFAELGPFLPRVPSLARSEVVMVLLDQAGANVFLLCFATTCLCLCFEWQVFLLLGAVHCVVAGPTSRVASAWKALEFNSDLILTARQMNLDVSWLGELAVTCRRRLEQGESFLALVVFDETVAVTLAPHVVSLRCSGIRYSDVCFVCFDEPSLSLGVSLNVSCLFVRSSAPLEPTDKYRMRLVAAYAVLQLGLDCYTLDSDLIFLGPFDKIWDGNCDLEMASNSPQVVESSKFSFGSSDPNAGLVKYRCSIHTLGFLRDVIAFSLSHRHVPDQAVIHSFLKHAVRVGEHWLLRRYYLLIAILEPLKAPTGSVLFCVGRERLRSHAIRMGVSRPLVVHLNWHLIVQAKVRTMRLLGWTGNNWSCSSFTWPFWTCARWPAGLQCAGRHVVLHDALPNSTVLTYRGSEIVKNPV